MTGEDRSGRPRDGSSGDGGADPGEAAASGKGAGGADRVGDVLGRLFRELGIEERIAEQDAVARWDEAVGERIAKVARPRAVSRGTLFVEVRSSPWLSELTLMRQDLLRRLNEGVSEGRIRRIVFTLAERPDEG